MRKSVVFWGIVGFALLNMVVTAMGQSLNGKFTKEKLFELSYGSDEGQIPHVEIDRGMVEPTGRQWKPYRKIERHGGIGEFVVSENGDIMASGGELVDDQDKSTLLFLGPSGQIKKKLILGPKAVRILRANDGGLYALDTNTNECLYFDNHGTETKRRKIDREMTLDELNTGKVQDVDAGYIEEKNRFIVQIAAERRKIKTEERSLDGYKYVYDYENRLKIIGLNKYGFTVDELLVFSGYQGTIQGTNPLNIDKDNNIYVFVEGYKSNLPKNAWTYDMLIRFIDIFDKDGQLVDEIPLERHDMDWAEQNVKQNWPVDISSIFVSDSGQIYRLKVKKDGVEFYRYR